MLFRYKNKVYVRPFANRIVEVKVNKINDNEYDVKPTENKVEITKEVNNELYSVTLKEAYEIQNKSNKESKLSKLDI